MSLKEKVRDYWEQEVCGSRYGEEDNFFRKIEEERYTLIPYLKDFVQFERGSGKRVLEIGVGAGTDFVNWLRNGAKVTGIDLTEAGIEMADKHAEFNGFTNADLKVGDAENLPFSDDSFDIVYSWGVLHHSPNTEGAFKEVARTLKPGGTFIGMIYHTPSVSEWLLWVRFALLKGRPFISPRQITYDHLESPGTKLYTVQEARDLLEGAGLSPTRVETKLSQGDLLEMKLSKKFNHPIYRIIQVLYPRWLIRLIGDKVGRVLLIEGTKPGPS